MSAILFRACDVGYGDEGKHGKKGASFISDLLLGKNWWFSRRKKLCEVKQKII